MSQQNGVLWWKLFLCLELMLVTFGGRFESSSAVLLRDAQCPKLCECKWKKGKETVSCPNANYIDIPVLEDPGTQVLDFRGNSIKVLVDGIFIHANLLNLQEIHLPRCKLREIHKFAFRDLTNLMRLDLSDNSLEAVPTAALASVSQLRELSLSGNSLLQVGDYAFSNLAHLIKLELSGCRLRSLSPHAFVGLDTLEWLKLDQNHLSHLNPVSIRPLANLHEMDLQQNPWNCSCAMRPTRRWMQRFNIHSTVPPSCESPDRLSQRSWSDLNIDDFACLPNMVHAGPVSQMQEETSNVTLMCRVMGEPPPQVDWLWQGQLIKNGSLGNLGSTLFLIQEDLYPRKDEHDIRTSNLTILNADIDHGGEYICEAFNQAGTVKARMQLTLAKPITTTLHKRVEQSRVYVMAAFGGCAVIFITLFLVCCVYSLRHKPISTIRQYSQQHYIRATTVDSEEVPALLNRTHGQSDGSGGKRPARGGSESISMAQRTQIMPKTPPLRTSCASTSLSPTTGKAETTVQILQTHTIKPPPPPPPPHGDNRHHEVASPASPNSHEPSSEESIKASRVVGTRLMAINPLSPNGVVGNRGSQSTLNGHPSSKVLPSSSSSAPSTTTSRPPPWPPKSPQSCDGPSVMAFAPTSKAEDPPAISTGSLNCSRSVRFNLKPIHFEEDWLPPGSSGYTPQVLLRSPSDPLISFCTLPRSASLFADSMPWQGEPFTHQQRLSNGGPNGLPSLEEEMSLMNRRVRFRTKSSSADSQEELLIDHREERHLPHTCGRVQPLASAMASKFRRFSGSYEYPLIRGDAASRRHHPSRVDYFKSANGKEDWRSQLSRNPMEDAANEFRQPPIWEQTDAIADQLLSTNFEYPAEGFKLSDEDNPGHRSHVGLTMPTYEARASGLTHGLIENRSPSQSSRAVAWRNSFALPPHRTVPSPTSSFGLVEDSDHKHVKSKREMISSAPKWGSLPVSGRSLPVANRRERNQKSSPKSDVNGQFVAGSPLNYRSNQLDQFLVEYQTLREQLIRMREACTNIRKVNLKQDFEDLRQSISSLEARCESSSNETVVANVADLKRRFESLHLRSILKKSQSTTHGSGGGGGGSVPSSTSPSTSHSSGSTSVGSLRRITHPRPMSPSEGSRGGSLGPPSALNPPPSLSMELMERNHFLAMECEDALELDGDDRFPLLTASGKQPKSYAPQWEHLSYDRLAKVADNKPAVQVTSSFESGD